LSETSADDRAAGAPHANLERLYLLVLRCQTGDQAAFADLYHQFSARTLRYLRGIVGDASADDVQQEVWLTVYRRLADVVNPAGFRTWLYRVTRHRAIDAVRREGRRSELIAATAEPFDPDAMPAAGPGAEEHLDGQSLEPVLARLSKVHREVLILRFREGLSYEEVAVVTGCSVGTVRSRLHHAKANVRAVLEAQTVKPRQGHQS
jgi:RNA polymerase sigma-70 factor (ECF subfamily)